MAISYLDPSGALLIVPGGYAQYTVQTAPSGLATTGVLMLVGEADAGPAFSEEEDLASNSFGPSDLADVVAKYKSGRLVDAYRAAVVPANDPNITGSPFRIIMAKTNVSDKASGTLPLIGGGTYSTLYDKSFGKLGNLISYVVTAEETEVKPTTGAFTLLVAQDYNISLRVNGGAVVNYSVAGLELPPTFVAGVDALAGIDATGGTLRVVIPVVIAGTLAVVATGDNIVITKSTAWTTTPTIGDTLYIPAGSAIQGATNFNRGSYVVTAATSLTISATKLLDISGPPGTVTPPENVVATPVVAITDLQVFAPVTITQSASVVVNGLGKTLEINELSTGTELLRNVAYQLNTTPVTWVSKSGDPAILNSATEYEVNLAISRQVDNVSETLISGGDIGLQLGYEGTTCSVTVSETTLTTVVVGGSGANLTVSLTDFSTISDLAAYIEAQTGYSASAGTAVLGQLPSTALDRGTFTAATTWGNHTGRIKVDAYKFYNAIVEGSSLVQEGNPTERADSGLPDVQTTTFMTGGTLGSTTDSDISLAFDALEAAQGNFLVPLFSQDASEDIADNLTDSGSTYTIDSVNANAKTHVLKMSTLKKRRNRQAFCSIRDTFDNDQEAAANLASFRVSLAFQDFKNTSVSGSIVQFQSWMGATLAAGMQAAGFYRSIFNKGINCSGVVSSDGDYAPTNETQAENALLAGLLPAKPADGGGFVWVSDQTTYSKDSNFVFNSIQAIYAADTVALTLAKRMEEAFVGQSLADVSATLALAAIESIMADLLRLKLIAPSDDAPKGFANVVIRISGPVMLVSLSIRLATSIYLIPISFSIQAVSQSASG